jgi:LmbE family N-acetylglucosaminyl deacetylase
MLSLRLDEAVQNGHLTILALGAHADDIEIGCGGTIMRLAELAPAANVHWVVLSGSAERAQEARASAADFLGGFASSRVVLETFRDGFFPYSGGEVKEFFEGLKAELSPDLILTHHRGDLHQDHRLVCELTWNTFRDHLILEYEVPKYDGDFGSPNFFVHLSEEIAAQKVGAILRHFSTQHDRRWFTEDLFLASLRLRGMESNAPSQRAEAFYCRKLVL